MDTPRVSPNGKWVAYVSYQSGRSEVYVQSFPPSDGKWQISTMGGMEPAWREDGKELYYANSDNLYAMQVKTDSGAFEPGVVKPLFRSPPGKNRAPDSLPGGRQRAALSGQCTAGIVLPHHYFDELAAQTGAIIKLR